MMLFMITDLEMRDDISRLSYQQAALTQTVILLIYHDKVNVIPIFAAHYD